MAQPPCPLCGRPAEAKDILLSEPGAGYRSASRVVCTTCGIYDISMMFEAMVEKASQRDHYRLSGVTREATERGQTLELTTTSAGPLLDTPALDPVDQAARVLDHLDAHGSADGSFVPLSPDRDYTLARSEGPKALQFVLDSLVRAGLIEAADQGSTPGYRLRMAGYERVKARKRADTAATTPTPQPTTPSPTTTTGANGAETAQPTPEATADVGWQKVDCHLSAAREQLGTARHEEQFQQVGLLCREALISVAQVMFDPQRHPTLDDVPASSTDAKRMLEAFFGATLAGQSNEEARVVAKASLRLALALQHDRQADRCTAAMCCEATGAVVGICRALHRAKADGEPK